MSAMEVFGIVSNTSAVVLSLLAIWMSQASERRSREAERRASEVLSQIDKRAEVTEQIVGEHFDRLMTTVLNIVNTATTDKDVRAAQINAETKAGQNQVQLKLMEMLAEVVKSGDPAQAKAFADIFETMTRNQRSSATI